MKKLLLLSAILTSPFSFTQDLSSVFEDVKYRNIGPFRGGRSVSSVGVLDNPQTYYMGTVGGGLWKTTNSGGEWFNISDALNAIREYNIEKKQLLRKVDSIITHYL